MSIRWRVMETIRTPFWQCSEWNVDPVLCFFPWRLALSYVLSYRFHRAWTGPFSRFKSSQCLFLYHFHFNWFLFLFKFLCWSHLFKLWISIKSGKRKLFVKGFWILMDRYHENDCESMTRFWSGLSTLIQVSALLS